MKGLQVVKIVEREGLDSQYTILHWVTIDEYPFSDVVFDLMFRYEKLETMLGQLSNILLLDVTPNLLCCLLVPVRLCDDREVL